MRAILFAKKYFLHTLFTAASFVIAVALSLQSCKTVVRNDAYFTTLSQYLYAYTSGSIGRNEPIRIRMVNAAVQQEQIGQKVVSSIFSVSPSIEGEAIWEDDRTILLQPKKPLTYGQRYEVTLGLDHIYKGIPDEIETFEFDFRVKELSFEVKTEGIRAEDASNLRKQQVHGKILTNDAVAEADVEKLLSAKQGARNLQVTWSHIDGGLTHAFSIHDVDRGNERSGVDISWNGQPLGLSNTGSAQVIVPSLDDFEVLSARIEQGESQYLHLNFSDPIATSQVLEGLIRIEGYDGQLRYSVDGNDVRVYPSKRITGNRRLVLDAGIRNTAGAGMKSNSTWPLGFENPKPGVRLVGRGAVIPGNDNGSIIFPFEAVGLTDVDVEIFKIYNSNILQHLQVNEIEGDNELERVGKITIQKRINLSQLKPNGSTDTWQRYALDLKDLIKQDPGAIYQVRLSFRKSYVISLNCNPGTAVASEPSEGDEGDGGEEGDESGPSDNDGTPRQKLDEPAIPSLDEYGNMRTIWGGYRGIYWADTENWWNSEGYEYNNRNNPCYEEYYCEDNFVKRNVFVSDLGLTAKRGKDASVFVAVTDLHTTEPMSGINLEFFNYQLQSIGKAATGKDGVTMVTNLRDVPFIMVATQGSHRGYLRMADGGTLSLSRFDVAGVETQRGLKGYIYGERGVWRPGDSIYLNFVLEDKTGKLPAGHPVTFELTDPKGALRQRTVVTKGVNGVYALHCATNAEAPTGNWSARVDVGGAKFYKTLKIETVKPNRLKLDLDFGKKYFADTDNLTTGKLNVKWLHGAIAKGLKATVEMQVRTAKTEYSGYKGFVFEDPSRSFYSDPQVLFEGNLDDNGNSNVPVKFENNESVPGKLIANFKVRAFESGGDFSTDNFSMDYFPFPRMVGVKMPENAKLNQANDIEFVCLSTNGKPLANQTLEVGMYRCDWRWWWDEDNTSNVSQFNSNTHVNAIDRATIKTDGLGRAIWKAKPSQWGRYLIRVVDEAGGHAAGGFFWVGYPSELDDLRSRNAAAMLPLAADKDKYNVGEEVTIKVPASENGRVLVTLENGLKVVEHLWFDTKAGDNLLKFRTTETMAPAVYAHISLLQPHAQTKNDLPIRMYGVVPIHVENPMTRLMPIIDMADAVRPEENFTVRVKEAKGMACAYTLAIVDEGLLDLTRFKTPNPWDELFAREALGVKTWDIYDYVLGAYGAEMERIIAIGGDGINQKARNAAQVNRFKPVVKHVGPFYLEKGKTASHNFKIDNYVGSVRVMVVMSNPLPDSKGAYGSAEKAVPVRKPLMVLPTLPRVLGPGETLRMPVSVFAMEKQVKDATIRLKEASGLVTIQGASVNNLIFSEPGEKMSYFDLKVGNKTGPARFQIEAIGGGETTTSTIEIMIRNPMPVTSNVWEGSVAAGQEWSTGYDGSQFSDIQGAVLEVSALPSMNLSRHLEYLIRYPHGCLEQTTSAAFPQLYVDAITPLTQKQKEAITRNVNKAIEKIQNLQDNSGGFAYWPGGQPEEWSSSYAGHFLLEAKAKGYAVPDNVIQQFVEFQTRLARGWQMPANKASENWYAHDGQIQQAYRLMTLASAGKPALGDMNRLKEAKEMYAEAAYLLASSYALAGKPEVAKELTSKSWRSDYSYDWCGYTYGSDLRDRSLILETYTLTGDSKRAEAMVNYIAQNLTDQNNYWSWSTQSLATALRAMAKYATQNSLSAGPNYTYRTEGAGGTKKGDSTKPYSRVVFSDNPAEAEKIVVKNTGVVKLYTRLVVTGQKTVTSEPAGEASNIRIDVTYKGMDGKPINLSKIPQGTDFVAEVTIARQTKFNFPFNELALTQIFPSGWEITNTRMGNFAAAAGSISPFEYQDIRDDRVNTYFDMGYNDEGSKTYRIQMNAAYKGRFYLPMVSCEAMYDARIRASVPGWWVEVI